MPRERSPASGGERGAAETFINWADLRQYEDPLGCAARSKMGARSAHSQISWTRDVTTGVEYSG